MITSILKTLADHLNAALGAAGAGGPSAEVGAPDGQDPDGGDLRILVTLVAIGREASAPPSPIGPPGDLTARLAKQPPLKLNLDVLLSAAGGAYQGKLEILERAIRILRYTPSLEVGAEDAPQRPLGRVQIELLTASIHDMNNIWSMLQSPMRPSALYRLRGAIIVEATTDGAGIIQTADAVVTPDATEIVAILLDRVNADDRISPDALAAEIRQAHRGRFARYRAAEIVAILKVYGYSYVRDDGGSRWRKEPA